MKKLIFGMLAGFGLWSAGAADAHWVTDLPRALAQAQSGNKLVLMDFSGSDWCEPCQMLVKNVFSKPEFAAYAATNLVLVDVDFPDKKPQTEALKTANLDLAKRFNIEGYPTLIVLKPDGREIWRDAGDPINGPADLISRLNGLKK